MTAAIFAAVAKRHTPKGWTVKYRESLTGRCFYRTETIATPPPTTARRLQIFLHECAHAVLHGPRSGKPRHREEYEAEMKSFQWMWESEIDIPQECIDRAKKYVGWKIKQAIKRGAKHIDPEASAFAAEV